MSKVIGSTLLHGLTVAPLALENVSMNLGFLDMLDSLVLTLDATSGSTSTAARATAAKADTITKDLEE